MATHFWEPTFWADGYWAEDFWLTVPDSVSSGTVAASLNGVSAQLVGSAEVSAYTGILNTSLSGVIASFGGTLAYITNFDLAVNVSVNWQLSSLGGNDGSISTTLEGVSSDLVGYASEGSYSVGLIDLSDQLWPTTFWDARLFASGFWPKTGELEGVTAAITGTLGSPGAFVGTIAASLENLTDIIVGQFKERAQFNAMLYAAFEGVIPSISGTSVRPLFTGSVAAGLDGVQSDIFGLATGAGSFVARIRTTLAGVAGQLSGNFQIIAKTGTVAATLEGVSSNIIALYIEEGGLLGSIETSLDGVRMLGLGTYLNPQGKEKYRQVTVVEIDWKTLCDQHNLGLPDEYDYEFSNGRRFKQA